QQVLSYLANYTHRVALSNRRIVAVDAQHQSVTFTYRDYRHGSLRKQLTLCALEFIRRFSLHILPPGLVRMRHYGILGNNRRKRDIDAARAILVSRGCALELQSHSVADPACSGMCCPLCGKTGIRLVAFIDAADVLHVIGVGLKARLNVKGAIESQSKTDSSERRTELSDQGNVSLCELFGLTTPNGKKL